MLFKFQIFTFICFPYFVNQASYHSYDPDHPPEVGGWAGQGDPLPVCPAKPDIFFWGGEVKKMAGKCILGGSWRDPSPPGCSQTVCVGGQAGPPPSPWGLKKKTYTGDDLLILELTPGGN